MSDISLEQRMAQGYTDLFPPFVPDERAPVSVAEQEDFYIRMRQLYQLACDEPLLFVPALHEDDAFPNRFNKTPYGKPELSANMKKFTKAVDGLVQNLFSAGQGQTIQWSTRQKKILDKLTVWDSLHPSSAWEWMATREGAHITAFSHCLFRMDYSYALDIYRRFFNSAALDKLVDWMREKGYKPFDIYHLIGTDCKLSLSYVNPKWGNTPPRGGFEYKIKHTGIAPVR